MEDAIVKGDITPGKKVLIMVHGRGAGPEDILTLENHLEVKNFSLIAPRAAGNTWYPYSFLMPQSSNEPHLSNSLAMLNKIVTDVVSKGINAKQIFFLGFSQGACLSLEYAARNAQRWGGVIAFTGGLIGDRLARENYKGDFEKTPVYIGTSDPDPHVPLARVRETEKVLKEMNADVEVQVFPDMGHTIVMEEIERAKRILGQGRG
jgi:phospholipase/carboxylesterase